jgi:hypothetical protein
MCYNLPFESLLEVCHKLECKFRDCWNPEHLYVGTHGENMRDKFINYEYKDPRQWAKNNGITYKETK